MIQATRLISWIFMVIVGAVAIMFAVSNRGSVTVDLAPLPLVFEAPMFAAVFAAVLVGFVGGGMVSFISGAKARRKVRRLGRQVSRLEKENDALKEGAHESDRDRASSPVPQSDSDEPFNPMV